VDKPLRFSIAIPAYNEAATLPKVLKGLEAALAGESYEILVVDDGSVDGTSAGVRPPVHLLRHAANLGHGAALKTALRAAKAPVLVVFDADGQHDPADIRRVLEALDGGNDLVVGARKDLWRQHNGRGNVIVSLFASVMSGLYIPDLTSGLRAVRRDKALEFVDLYPDRFCFELTTTTAFALKGYRVSFIDIDARVRQAGHSKIRVVWDGMRFGALVLKYVWVIKPQRLLALAAGFAAAGATGFFLTRSVFGGGLAGVAALFIAALCAAAQWRRPEGRNSHG